MSIAFSCCSIARTWARVSLILLASAGPARAAAANAAITTRAAVRRTPVVTRERRRSGAHDGMGADSTRLDGHQQRSSADVDEQLTVVFVRRLTHSCPVRQRRLVGSRAALSGFC